MFERVRKAMQKFGANSGLAKEYKDVFDIEDVPSFRQFYNMVIFPAKYVYKGLYNPWHIVDSPTIANSKRVRTMFRMDTAKAVCAELAGLIWSESAEIHVTSDTEEKSEKLQAFVDKILKDNAFTEKLQQHIEQSCALGGGAIKAFVKYKKDDNGNKIAGTEKVVLDYCTADQFVPTAWDNAKVYEGFFVSRKAKDGYYYTKIEWHKWNGDTYVISNDLFRASEKDVNGQNQDILGFRYPLNEVYGDLQPEVEINGLKQTLFCYYRPPQANNVDDNSPLGIPIYANAMDTLHAIDICYDSLVREFRLGRRRIIVPASAIRTVVDPQTSEVRRFFDANDEVYEAFSTDGSDALKIQDNTVSLRVEEHVQALNSLLSVLCLQVGFSSNTFTFDMQNGFKTATEVISENSKTYKTISNFQTQLKAAIEHLVENIIDLAKLYEIEYDGMKISDIDDYEISVVMEDAVLEDSSVKLDRALKLMTNGLLSKKTIMMNDRYGLGMTEAEADAELERINKENQISVGAVDVFGSYTS